MFLSCTDRVHDLFGVIGTGMRNRTARFPESARQRKCVRRLFSAPASPLLGELIPYT